MAYRSRNSDRLMSVTTSSRLSHLVWEGRVCVCVCNVKESGMGRYVHNVRGVPCSLISRPGNEARCRVCVPLTHV